MRFFPFLSLTILLFPFAFLSDGLNTDGVLLMSFKFSVFSDPLAVLQSWRHDSETPCSWRGVKCDEESRVIELSLPNSLLLGSLPANLGMIENLQSLDLSNNLINGPLPFSLFQAKHLRFLDLSMNSISESILETVGQLQSLQSLNLSDNALAGKLPTSLISINNLTVVSLRRNYLIGELPGGFRSVQLLDLSSNMLNGTLPRDFGGSKIKYLNLSYNSISGSIPASFGSELRANATIDLSYNNLTGLIPVQPVFQNQPPGSFDGNSDLCGENSKKPCSPPPARSPEPSTPPAIAAIPRTRNFNPVGSSNQRPALKTGVIIGIVAGGAVGIIVISFALVFLYKLKKKRIVESKLKKEANSAKDISSLSSSSSTYTQTRGFSKWSCLRKRGDLDVEEDDEDEEDDLTNTATGTANSVQHFQPQEEGNAGTLVILNGDKKLELETLLKASAYILGASGSSIVYKAILDDGTVLAVRRLGDTIHGRLRDFENKVRTIAKLVHPNLVRVRGFFWGADEKLIIYEFVPNGSLANVRSNRKPGSSPRQLSWEIRLKIAKGLARGLSYLHEKKHVHGNLQPNNILLGIDMEPKIAGIRLEKLLTGETSIKSVGSARIFGSHRSMMSQEELTLGPTVSPSPSSSSVTGVSPYHAPESFRSLKPTPKWDVYSFGVIFTELIIGKVTTVEEVSLALEDGKRAIRIADVVVRAELEGREEVFLDCLRLGVRCCSQMPQRRPSMREICQVFEKISVTS